MTATKRFTDRPSAPPDAIPCFRCGVCCERWQPLVTRQEAERIASYLGLPTQEFLERYARPYPLQEDTHILRNNGQACVFLRYDDGLATCTIHEVRPQPCRDWQASLSRKECREGLQRMVLAFVAESSFPR